MMSRILDKRLRRLRHTSIPKYKTRRRNSRYYLFTGKVKRRTPPPPYKQRREFRIQIQDLNMSLKQMIGEE